MISYITGKIKKKKDNSLVIIAGNIYYEVLIPLAVMKAMERGNVFEEQVELVTYHYYQMEPSRAVPVLIGFQNEIEKEFFEKFISVSGVGPKAACKALAEPFSVIAGAIDNADITFLKKLPGIGEQRARLIIAKLQGKVGKYGLIRDTGSERPDTNYSDIKSEAVEVLLQLQYKRNEAESMIDTAIRRNPEVKTSEELLNEVYKIRSQK
ncbi:MAG: Holliday junction branch migration protein RuvA [Candidatus Omnitrophota bacterium]